jgi:hypothetical protein
MLIGEELQVHTTEPVGIQAFHDRGQLRAGESSGVFLDKGNAPNESSLPSHRPSSSEIHEIDRRRIGDGGHLVQEAENIGRLTLERGGEVQISRYPGGPHRAPERHQQRHTMTPASRTEIAGHRRSAKPV